MNRPLFCNMLNSIKSLQLHNKKIIVHKSSMCCRKYCSSSTKPSDRIIFSGIQPTGSIHLGNYCGAISNWISLQNSDCKTIYSIMDLHAITMDTCHNTLHDRILECAATLIACGIDPDISVIFQQSKVPQHLQLYWVLSSKSTMAKLWNLAQFREKSAKFPKSAVPTGLFKYPMLQAADILLYKTTHVPVGKDQLHHINFTADVATRANNIYGRIFTIPNILNPGDDFASIKSFLDVSKKMSKSDKPSACLFITDLPDEMRAKIKGCNTETVSDVRYDTEKYPMLSNLMTIQSAVTKKTYDIIEKEAADLDSESYKEWIATTLVEYFSPIQNKFSDLLANKDYLENVLKKGSQQATELASLTFDEVKGKVGFLK